jgi:plasmid stabilization system protein ParE
MSLRFTPRALAEAKRLKRWWRRNRPAAPDTFEQELDAALDRIEQAPGLGKLYEKADLGVPVRRVLLPGSLNHV